MRLVIVFLYFVFAYYFVLKNEGKGSAKFFSLCAGVLFILNIAPIWNFTFFVYLLAISSLFPFIFGIVGLVFAWFGVKGGTRGFLMLGNSLAILIYLFVYMMGIFGFQES